MTNEEEVLIEDDEFIVSRTDKQGIITYVSDSFCRISEYDKSELIGQPHSIIRHPDMPKSAFKDMWETIKQGNKWQGYVKNRTKYGKFYWVEATVSPLVKDGKMLGYKSVRHKPDPKILEEKIYQYRELRKMEDANDPEIVRLDGVVLSSAQQNRIIALAKRIGESESKTIDTMMNLLEKMLNKKS